MGWANRAYWTGWCGGFQTRGGGIGESGGSSGEAVIAWRGVAGRARGAERAAAGAGDGGGCAGAVQAASGKGSSIKMVSFNGSSFALKDVASGSSPVAADGNAYTTGFFKLWGLPSPA